jgi:uncharacterized protein YndB with AHSA1/START domain
MTTSVRIVRDYPHPPAKVWRALTEPALMALWGMRPVGFLPIAGTRFKFVAKPNPAWRGFVECEVLEARAPALLRYAWDDDGKGKTTFVTYTLEARGGGTRLTLEHTGFSGFSGWVFARFMMEPGWKKTTSTGLPALLAELGEDGNLRSGSTLRPRF